MRVGDLGLRKAALEASGWHAVPVLDEWLMHSTGCQYGERQGVVAECLAAGCDLLLRCPAVESNPGVSEPWFLEFCVRNGYGWDLSDCTPHDEWTALHYVIWLHKEDWDVEVEGATPSECRAKAVNRDAAQWPTPASRDWKGDNSEAHLEIGGGQEASRPVTELRYAHLPAFPPGPSDHEAWRRIIERWPELAPALADSDSVESSADCRESHAGTDGQYDFAGSGPVDDDGQEEAESKLRRLADGIPAGMDFRVDRLRAGGNAVVPLQAAFAFATLARKAGIIDVS